WAAAARAGRRGRRPSGSAARWAERGSQLVSFGLQRAAAAYGAVGAVGVEASGDGGAGDLAGDLADEVVEPGRVLRTGEGRLGAHGGPLPAGADVDELGAVEPFGRVRTQLLGQGTLPHSGLVRGQLEVLLGLRRGLGRATGLQVHHPQSGRISLDAVDAAAQVHPAERHLE